MTETEVIIVGGGPAGAACALKLRQHHVPALILDKREFPRTKLCAGWVTPSVWRDLQVHPGDYPHSLLRLWRLHVRIHGRRMPIPTRQYSIRRYEFDHWLLRQSGVPVQRHEVQSVRRENGAFVLDEQFRSRYLVGAGGTNCPVYRALFSKENPRRPELRITSMEQEFQYPVRDRNCYLWFYEHDLPGYSWYVPKGNGYLNTGIGGKFETLKSRGENIRDHWEKFSQKLAERGLVKDFAFAPRGHNYYLRQPLHHPSLGNAFLTGDAAGLATIDMGEGIGPAIRSGLLAAQAIIGGGEYSLKTVGRYSLPDVILPWRLRLPGKM